MSDADEKQVYRRTLSGFIPANPASDAFAQSVKLGDLVELKGRRPRNLRHHNLFFSALELLFQNQERYATKEELLAAVKVALGHCNYVVSKGGHRIAIPKSIAFGTMDQAAFNAFWDKFCTLVETKIIPGMKREDLERELREMGVAA